MALDISVFKNILKKNVINQTLEKVFVGIDIGSTTLKVIQIKNVKGVPVLDTYGELQLGPYEGVDIGRSTHLSEAKLTEALIDILREASVTGKQATFSIPYSASFVSVIPVATRDQEKIADMISVEARKYIPVPLSKIALDWSFLASGGEEDIRSYVLLMASYKQTISMYTDIVQNARLVPYASEIEILSTLRAVVNPSDDAVVVIDFGGQSTRMNIIQKGIVYKTHSVPLSGVDITAIIAKTLKISFTEAERIKRIDGIGTKNVVVQKEIVNIIERNVRELHIVTKRYEDEHDIQIQKIVITGGASLLPGIDVYVHEMFSLPIERAQPFNKISYPAFLQDILREAGPSFSVAVGLALYAFHKNL